MSAQCAVCHKKSMRGNLVSHSKQRTHRMYRVNLHTIKMLLGGVKQTLRVCTTCLRTLKKDNHGKTFVKPAVSVTPVIEVAAKTKPVISTKPVTIKEEVEEKDAKSKEIKVRTTTIAELMKESGDKVTADKKEAKKTVESVKPKARTRKKK